MIWHRSSVYSAVESYMIQGEREGGAALCVFSEGKMAMGV